MDHRLFDGGCARVQSMQANGSVQRARSNILIIKVDELRFPSVVPPKHRRRRRLPQAVHAQRLSALAEWSEVHGPLHRGVRLHAPARHNRCRPVLAAELTRPDRYRRSRRPGLLAALAKPGLSDVWQAAAPGRIPNVLHWQMARFCPQQGRSQTGRIRLRRVAPNMIISAS
jgi:hypothetical protein